MTEKQETQSRVWSPSMGFSAIAEAAHQAIETLSSGRGGMVRASFWAGEQKFFADCEVRPGGKVASIRYFPCDKSVLRA